MPAMAWSEVTRLMPANQSVAAAADACVGSQGRPEGSAMKNDVMDHAGHTAPGAPPGMSASMATEMGHSGMDLAAMVGDMRNRFWICLIFTVAVVVYASM